MVFLRNWFTYIKYTVADITLGTSTTYQFFHTKASPPNSNILLSFRRTYLKFCVHHGISGLQWKYTYVINIIEHHQQIPLPNISNTFEISFSILSFWNLKSFIGYSAKQCKYLLNSSRIMNKVWSHLVNQLQCCGVVEKLILFHMRIVGIPTICKYIARYSFYVCDSSQRTFNSVVLDRGGFRLIESNQYYILYSYRKTYASAS